MAKGKLMKQIIVVRKDLNMRKGKIAAQVAHASMKVLLDRQITLVNKSELVLELTPEMYSWLFEEAFTKICVSVNSEQELLDLQAKANELNVPNALIVDSGKTEFNGVPTVTCLAIGPHKEEVIDSITGGLPLL
jgi:PTH2 family peptidyl-tRNA hydrolase